MRKYVRKLRREWRGRLINSIHDYTYCLKLPSLTLPPILRLDKWWAWAFRQIFNYGKKAMNSKGPHQFFAGCDPLNSLVFLFVKLSLVLNAL